MNWHTVYILYWCIGVLVYTYTYVCTHSLIFTTGCCNFIFRANKPIYLYVHIHTNIYSCAHSFILYSCVRLLINSCLLVAQLCMSFFRPPYRPHNIHLNCHALSQHWQAYTITLLFIWCNNSNTRTHGNTLN